jgi:hypothetical protein
LYVIRAILVALLVGSTMAWTGCDPAPTVEYDNQTRHRLCVYPDEVPPDDFCDEIEPNERRSTSMAVCKGDDPLWITLTVGQGGDLIYRRFATCGEWEGATVIIQQDGDEFVVTDSLPTDP